MIPADLCYWGVLAVEQELSRPVWSGQRESLGFEDEFQAAVPLDLADLHVAYTPAGPTKVLACAVPRDLAQDASEQVLSLRPEAIPDELGAGVGPEQVELLGGDCEPRQLRRAGNTVARVLASVLLLTALVIVAGLERRRSHFETVTAAAEAGRVGTLRDRFGNMDPGTAARALVQQLEQERLLHGESRSLPPDAAMTTAAMLDALSGFYGGRGAGGAGGGGGGGGVDTELVSCTEFGAVITLNGSDEAGEVLERLRVPPGWTLAEPRVLQTPKGRQFTLQFAREKRGNP